MSAPTIPSRATARTWAARLSTASIGTIVEFSARLIRTAALSRLLAPTEFGTCMAISAVLATAEMISDVGTDKFVMLGARADAERRLAAATVIQLVRGLTLAILIAALALPAANFFGVPHAAHGFALAALVPLVRSFSHLGVKQIQRDYDFRPEAIAITGAQAAALILGIAAALVFRDHRALVSAFLAEAAIYSALSHRLVRMPFSVQTQRSTMREALAYGLPLSVNGVGLALIAQADRLVVGSELSVDALATYAVILTIAVVPIGLLFRVSSGLGAPFLARAQAEGTQPGAAISFVIWAFYLMATVCAVTLAAAIDRITPVVFGAHYQVGSALWIPLALIVFLRIAKGGGTLTLLTSGRTRQLIASTLVSGLGIVTAAILLPHFPSLTTVLWCVACGDIVSAAMLQWNTAQIGGVANRSIISAHIGGVCACACVSLAASRLLDAPSDQPWLSLGLGALLAVALVAATMRAWRMARGT